MQNCKRPAVCTTIDKTTIHDLDADDTIKVADCPGVKATQPTWHLSAFVFLPRVSKYGETHRRFHGYTCTQTGETIWVHVYPNW